MFNFLITICRYKVGQVWCQTSEWNILEVPFNGTNALGELQKRQLLYISFVAFETLD